MEKVKAEQNLTRNSLDVACAMWYTTSGHCLPVRHHHRKHKTQVGAIRACMIEVIEQFNDIGLSGVIPAASRYSQKHGEFSVILGDLCL